MKIPLPGNLMNNPAFLQEEYFHLTMQNLHIFTINLLSDKFTKSARIIIFRGFGITETFKHTVTIQNLRIDLYITLYSMR